MKLLAIDTSRVVSLFEITRLEGQPYLPQMAMGLIERYSFAGAPESYQELSADQVSFNHGLFEGSAIQTLEMYNDGVVVSAKSDTDVIDAFLEDVLGWAEAEFGFSIVKSRKADRMYESQLLFEADPKILKPLSSLFKLSRKVSGMVEENSGIFPEFREAGILLATDHTQIASLKPIPFRVERRLTSEYSLNQFFSSAPLKTKQHLEAIKYLEELS